MPNIIACNIIVGGHMNTASSGHSFIGGGQNIPTHSEYSFRVGESIYGPYRFDQTVKIDGVRLDLSKSTVPTIDKLHYDKPYTIVDGHVSDDIHRPNTTVCFGFLVSIVYRGTHAGIRHVPIMTNLDTYYTTHKSCMLSVADIKKFKEVLYDKSMEDL